MRNPKYQVIPGFLIGLAVGLLCVPIKWILAWIIAAYIHEVGHYLSLQFFKIPIHSVKIGLLGAKIEAAEASFPSNVFCSLAGPAAGLCLVFFLRQFPRIALCGLIQSCWNLIPITPMDGGHALQGILLRFFPRYALALQKKIELTLIILVSICIIYLAFKYSLGMIPVVAWGMVLLRNKKEKFLANSAH